MSGAGANRTVVARFAVTQKADLVVMGTVGRADTVTVPEHAGQAATV